MLDFIGGIFSFIWGIISFLWMVPVRIFEAIIPITFLHIDSILAHSLTFVLYVVALGFVSKILGIAK